MMLYLGQLNEVKTQTLWPTAILKISKLSCISSASQPIIRPGCAKCRAPEILHHEGNGGRFTKMLFRR